MPFSNLISLYNAFIQVWDKNKAHWKGILGGQTTLCQSGTGDILLPSLSSVIYPGRVLPLCWVIWMCRRFDPLFWHSEDSNRSFGGIFSHPPTPKQSFGVLKLPILTEFDLLGPKFHFSLDLFGSNFQRPAAHPHQFSDRVPPRGDIYPSARLSLGSLCYTIFPHYHVLFYKLSNQMTTVLSIPGGADVPCGIRILGCIDGARMLNCGRCE